MCGIFFFFLEGGGSRLGTVGFLNVGQELQRKLCSHCAMLHTPLTPANRLTQQHSNHSWKPPVSLHHHGSCTSHPQQAIHVQTLVRVSPPTLPNLHKAFFSARTFVSRQRITAVSCSEQSCFIRPHSPFNNPQKCAFSFKTKEDEEAQ